MTRRLMVAAAAVLCVAGYNDPPRPRTGPPPPPPKVAFAQRLGTKVPLDLPFKDSDGRRVTLGDCTAGRPTVLVMGYYRCPMLCTQVRSGLVEALRQVPDSAGGAFSVVQVSVDPREKPPLAAVVKAADLERYSRPGAEDGWHALTGDPLAVATLADDVGFGFEYDPATEQYAHGSGLVVLAPDGTVSRYLFGVRYPPRDLRLALAEASDGTVGTPADQVLLLCYRYDPATGGYTLGVLKLVRLLSGVGVLGIGGLVVGLAVRGRRQPAAQPAPAEG